MGSARSTVLRVRYRPIAGGGGGSEAGSLAFTRGGGVGAQLVEAGHRSMRTYYRQSYRPSSSALGAVNPQLHALMLQYAKAGVLAQPLGGVRHGAAKAGRHERSTRQVHQDKKAHLAQGINNNKTMNGMKHFKNQSLNF